MNTDELMARYRDFTTEAARLETLQTYVVPGDEERQEAFRQGRPLSFRPGKAASLELIAGAVATGKRIGRIHVVDRPLSDYVRYEFAAYDENIRAGESVLITDRAADPALASLTHDFVLFDGYTDHALVVWYDYTPEGLLIGYRKGSPEDIAVASAALELARRHAVPLADFTTST
ncbi:hypothetical protein Val02_44470 [Virgisporangium aliadipatigenens]|uniref:DUF6879 domain-containing protein n=1 Tax=Virgisporangium aliadipatigenens TaxID=741659 RepID=A0A8J4DRX3_9ACTN|nr:DUF6879 family protein [Virgisporangium aliadipatigenens]GIJ47561.1 hypothetical protein Val02_44470 [Virgisporangium aliadipatigenens]